jgi:hypothetical protein
MLTTGSGSGTDRQPVVRSVVHRPVGSRIELTNDHRPTDLLCILLLDRSPQPVEAPNLSGWIRRLSKSVSNGRLTVFTRQVVGAEGSSVPNPVAGAEAVVVAVSDSSGWDGFTSSVGPPPPFGQQREGVLIGVTVGPEELLLTHRSTGVGHYAPPPPLHLPEDCTSFTLSL